MKKEIKLCPRVNKANKQVSFQLKKSSLPKEFKSKLSQLKGVTIKFEDFDFD